jgi:diguanylate cyclase
MTETPPRLPRLLITALTLAFVSFVASVLLGLLGVKLPGWAYDQLPLLVSALSALCTWWAVWASPPGGRPGRILFAIGATTLAGGDVVYNLYGHLTPGGEPPFPSWADALYLLYAPLVAMGMYRMLNPPRGAPLARLALDIGTVVITVFVLLWHFVYATSVAEAGQQLTGLIVNLSYPVQDSMLVSLVMLMAFQERVPLSRPAVVWLNLGFVITFMADVAYAYLLPEPYSLTNQTMDMGFTFCQLAMGMAMIMAVCSPGETRSAPRIRLTTSIPYAAILICFSLLIASLFRAHGAFTLITIGDLLGTALVTLIVVLRQNLSFRETTRLTEALAYRATHDPLTGLANRTLLESRLGEAISEAARAGTSGAVLFIDIDRFKGINDNLGHDVGDQLLISVARVLQAGLPAGATLARPGGDEFIVVLPGLQQPGEAMHLTRTLMENLNQPMLLLNHTLKVTASVGVALFPRDGNDSVTLQKRADTAMYRVKASGRGGAQSFVPEMAPTLAALDLEQALHGALARGEFELHYQPQMHAQHATVGAEALLRWRREGALLPPSSFIGLAEETGLIVPIGAWVLAEATRQCAAWQQAGLRGLRVAVNISARQLAAPDFVKTVQAALSSAGLEPQYLELELTESMVLHDLPGSVRQLGQLRTLGVRLAVDDFGTGQSSLSLLRQLPADVLKIDRSFVAGLEAADPEAAEGSLALVQLVIALAHSLKLGVVAEGVETAGQWAALQQLGCLNAQGYLFSPGLSAAACGEWLLAHQETAQGLSRPHDLPAPGLIPAG